MRCVRHALSSLGFTQKKPVPRNWTQPPSIPHPPSQCSPLPVRKPRYSSAGLSWHTHTQNKCMCTSHARLYVVLMDRWYSITPGVNLSTVLAGALLILGAHMIQNASSLANMIPIGQFAPRHSASNVVHDAGVLCTACHQR